MNPADHATQDSSRIGGPDLPLTGVRVLCLAGQYPGPYATLILADMGADVVMVERPPIGDPTRAMPPFFESLNRGKRSITIDFADGADRSRLQELAARCDVFIEGARPGVATKLGVDANTLRARNDRLIYVSISAFGQDGPYSERAAHDLSIQALAGLQHGREAIGAAPPYVPWGDVLSGVFAACGVVAALYRRTSGGRGATLDVSMLDCLASAMTPSLAPLLNGEHAFCINQPAYGNFCCSDGRWINLSITHEDHLWQRLMATLGLDDLSAVDTAARTRNASAIRRRLADTFAAHPRAHWERVLSTCDTAWAPVLAPEEVIADPQLASRGLFAALASKDGRRALRQPVRCGPAPVDCLRPAPGLGDSNAETLWDVSPGVRPGSLGF